MQRGPRFPTTIVNHFNAIGDPATRANFLTRMDTALATVTTAGVRAQHDYSSGGNTGHNQFKEAISALTALRDADGITAHRDYIDGQIRDLQHAGPSARHVLLNNLRVNLESTKTKLDQAAGHVAPEEATWGERNPPAAERDSSGPSVIG